MLSKLICFDRCMRVLAGFPPVRLKAQPSTYIIIAQ